MEFWRVLIKILVALIVLYLLTGGIIYFFPQRFTYLPKKLTIEKTLRFDQVFEEVYIDSIHGVYFPTNLSSKGLVLYFHGNKGNLQRWGNYATDFTKLGYDFFAIDYPGYGKTKGSPSEIALYKSAEEAYKWSIQRYPKDSIILYGRSLGSAPAAYLANKHSARMLILETPFYNFQDLYEKHLILSLFPITPDNQFKVNEYIQGLNYPVFVFHGTKDKIIPLESAIQLKPLLTDQSRFSIIEGGGHRNLNTFKDYHQQLKSILAPQSAQK